MKLELFKRPVYWHIADVDYLWKAKESKSAAIIKNCFDGKYSVGDDVPLPSFNLGILRLRSGILRLRSCIMRCRQIAVRVLNPPRAAYYRWRVVFLQRIVPALRGERWVWERIWRRCANLLARAP
jgi:hypothetical protein